MGGQDCIVGNVDGFAREGERNVYGRERNFYDGIYDSATFLVRHKDIKSYLANGRRL